MYECDKIVHAKVNKTTKPDSLLSLSAHATFNRHALLLQTP